MFILTNRGIHKVQMIKGWNENGEQKELVQDIACADGTKPEGGRCPAPSSTIDLTTCKVSGDSGASSMEVHWRDPTFNDEYSAFFYVRVLQSPTCRWSTYDAIRLGIDPIPEVSPLIQERAWSSPVWYSPFNNS